MNQDNQNILRRSRKQRAFTQIDNEITNNENLSWQAKGMMLYLLSKPDDWKFYESDIVKRAKNGPDSVKSIIKELLAEGYLIRGERLRDERGHLKGYNYTVEPYLFESYDGKSYIGKSNVGKSKLGKPYVGKSNDNNTNSSNTKSFNNTNSSNTNNKQQSRSSLSSQIFELIESNNFAALNSYTSQEVEYMIKDTSEELTLEAFKIAIDENKRKLKYVKGIIRNWKNAKLKTLADLEIYESTKRGEQNASNNQGTPKQYSDGVNF